MISEDHVTLKTDDGENTAFYTLTYIHIENTYLKL